MFGNKMRGSVEFKAETLPSQGKTFPVNRAPKEITGLMFPPLPDSFVQFPNLQATLVEGSLGGPYFSGIRDNQCKSGTLGSSLAHK